ncbi:MAG: FliH/SctL family protein [Polyangiaceae bacterium]|nr:FliH/SctL family protein [Polyangiaceae bacterium]
MSIERARIIKGTRDPSPAVDVDPPVLFARRIPKALADAHEEASRIVAKANERASEIIGEARASVAHIAAEASMEAREQEIAKLAAELLVVRAAEEVRREQEMDRTIEMAVLLAERIIGEALRIDPGRIAFVAAEALRETRGARQLRIEANPDDVAALHAALEILGAEVANVVQNRELCRGSLVVHTELGRVDARVRPQLARLADALREALRSPASARSRPG